MKKHPIFNQYLDWYNNQQELFEVIERDLPEIYDDFFGYLGRVQQSYEIKEIAMLNDDEQSISIFWGFLSLRWLASAISFFHANAMDGNFDDIQKYKGNVYAYSYLIELTSSILNQVEQYDEQYPKIQEDIRKMNDEFFKIANKKKHMNEKQLERLAKRVDNYGAKYNVEVFAFSDLFEESIDMDEDLRELSTQYIEEQI